MGTLDFGICGVWVCLFRCCWRLLCFRSATVFVGDSHIEFGLLLYHVSDLLCLLSTVNLAGDDLLLPRSDSRHSIGSMGTEDCFVHGSFIKLMCGLYLIISVAKFVQSFVDLILTRSVSEGFSGIVRPSLTLRVARIPLLAVNH